MHGNYPGIRSTGLYSTAAAGDWDAAGWWERGGLTFSFIHFILYCFLKLELCNKVTLYEVNGKST